MINTKRVDINDVYLYAVNTGEFYAHQCTLAKRPATRKTWANHVLWNVMKRYRQEFGAEHYLHGGDVDTVAKQLKDYYEKHVNER